jgi:hypothetical protein
MLRAYSRWQYEQKGSVMYRSVFIMVFTAIAVGCSSGPTGSLSEPLSADDARICSEEADLFSALATLRANKVAKRQAVSRQIKKRNVAGMDGAERKEATSEVYESAIIVYAIPELSPATLHALKWSECKVKALRNEEMNYGDILAIKDGVVRCQQDSEQKGTEKLRACVEGVVGTYSREMSQPKELSMHLCRTTIKSSIDLHKKALRLAKKGKKNTALDSLEASMEKWKKIASGGLGCSKVEKAIAADGILRADHDINTIARAY